MESRDAINNAQWEVDDFMLTHIFKYTSTIMASRVLNPALAYSSALGVSHVKCGLLPED
jgi:hypothetical protein